MPNALGMTSTEVCRKLDITYRQLNYWCNRVPELSRVKKTGSGVPRLFTPSDIEVLGRVRDLTIQMEEIKTELQRFGLWGGGA